MCASADTKQKKLCIIGITENGCAMQTVCMICDISMVWLRWVILGIVGAARMAHIFNGYQCQTYYEHWTIYATRDITDVDDGCNYTAMILVTLRTLYLCILFFISCCNECQWSLIVHCVAHNLYLVFFFVLCIWCLIFNLNCMGNQSCHTDIWCAQEIATCGDFSVFFQRNHRITPSLHRNKSIKLYIVCLIGEKWFGWISINGVFFF